MIQKKFFHRFHIVQIFLVLSFGISILALTGTRVVASENIAVLPFKINMLEPEDRFELELQQMLTARLSEKGFQLVDTAIINKSELAGIKLADLDLAKKMGKEKDIDWLIKGSFTQIGEKISVDLTIIPTSTEKKPFPIFVVGDVIDKLDEIIDRVAVLVKNRIEGIFQIDSVNVTGNRRIETEAIIAVIRSQQGTIFYPENLDKDLRAIYQMGFFEDVQTDVQDSTNGKTVTFKVTEKPSIGKITFKGNKKFDNKELMEVLGIKEYSIFDSKNIKDSIERLKDHYNKKGYYNVEITEKVEDLPDNEVALIYEIQEGEKVYIRSIKFLGNDAFSDDDLKDIMGTQEKGFFSFITDSGRLDTKNLEDDIFKIKSFYYNNGFIKARVSDPEISYNKDEGLSITIAVNEGPQYSIGKVEIEGDLIKDVSKLYQELKITKEKVYNREIIRADVLKLSEIYSDEGYAFVNISPGINENDEQHIVDITYRISKGDKVRIEKITITGNEKTRDKVIRRELKAIEGGYFSGQNLKRSSQNLNLLGFFEGVEMNTVKGNIDDSMVLNVNVKERQSGLFTIGAGYSSDEGVLGILEISQNNLFGLGQSLSAKISLSSKSSRYMLSFTEPWLFDERLSAGIDLYSWEYEYDEYTKDSLGGKLRLGFPLWLDFTTGLATYTYDDAYIYDVSENASQVIKDMEGTNITSSLTLGASRDSRDRRFNPTKGSTNSLSVEYAGGILGGDNYFTKYIAKSAWFFPFFLDSAFSVQGRWGYIERRPGGKLPVYEKFRLGGMNTVRGFSSGGISPIDPLSGDRIGGEKMMVYNFEFRFPLLKEQGVVGVLFFDAGNVFTKDESLTFEGIRAGAGCGVRWYSPMGPLRLEWGYNLDPRRDESSGEWEFSIGTPF